LKRKKKLLIKLSTLKTNNTVTQKKERKTRERKKITRSLLLFARACTHTKKGEKKPSAGVVANCCRTKVKNTYHSNLYLGVANCDRIA